MTALAAVGEGLAELALTNREPVRLDFGGDAANVCVMAARMGISARLAGRVGDDELGRRLLAFLSDRDVDVSWVRRDAGAPTGLYVNEPDSGGGHRFTYLRSGSAGSRLDAADLEKSFFAGLGTLVFTGVTLAVSRSSAAAAERATAEARRHGATVACVLNHRPALHGDVAELAVRARESDVLIASTEDARAVFATGEPAELARSLAGGPHELVLTDGNSPATAVWNDGAVRRPVPRVAACNAAGAGDALAGAYLAARLHGSPPAASLALGVAAATLSVQRPGCAGSYPTSEQAAALARRLAPAQPSRATVQT